jgi:hypothetical protein
VSTDPRGWLDRLVGACVSLFLGALALYAAVQLVEAIWLTLAIALVAVALLVGLVALWRARRARW